MRDAWGKLLRRLVLLGLILGWALPLLAGSSSDLKGRVTDRSGSPLAGATVIVRNDLLAVSEHGTVTGADGSYLLRGLLPGPGYRVRASLPTFAPVELSDVTLEGSEVTTLDIVLRSASEVRETVKVEGHPDVVNTESVTISTTFTSAFIADLPLLGRDYQDILTLAPGVTDVDHTGNPNIHGARDTDVVTLVDGVSTTDPFTGYYGQNLNIESIQEIEVITSGATAEFSRAQGGFANIITKSGSNEFAGTFKLYVRSNRLDGAGAGIDPPELHDGFTGPRSLREVSFTDLKPFLSLSGAIVKDRLWYYLASEYIQEETPINALTHAFVTRTLGYREFGKMSWQMAPAHRLAFSAIFDMERNENRGITSLRDTKSGYTFQRGGPTYTLKETGLFNPSLSLDSTVSWFDNRFSDTPVTGPDTNGNGILYTDWNHDGMFEAKERDAGEDWDADLAYDVSERNLVDLDGDGRLRDTSAVPCEGRRNEDLNCNGVLDAEVDLDNDGILQPFEDGGLPCVIPGLCPDGIVPGTADNGKRDTEDANHNGRLDVVGESGYTPYPFWQDRNGNRRPDPGEYQAPQARDGVFLTDSDGRSYGPYPYQYQDSRYRLTVREDLSAFVPAGGGTHEIKTGLVLEREGYDRTTQRDALLTFLVTKLQRGPRPVYASLAIPAQAANTASGENLGLYLEDTYKPLPNLALGLGVRVDFEDLSSHGFSPFDPRAERSAFDALANAAGIDTDPFDFVTNVGLCSDSLHSCGPGQDTRLADIQSTLLRLANQSLTRHNLDVSIVTPFSTASGISGSNTAPGTEVKRRESEDFRITNANLAPRLSLSWDPWGDGKSKLFASWGRFYDKLFLSSLVLEQGPDTVSRVYQEDPVGWSGISHAPDYRLGRVVSQSPLSTFQVDRSLATPHTDEWTLGIERELAPELSLGLRYIQRDFRDQLQDIDINHHVVIDPRTGAPADRIGEVQCDKDGANCNNWPDGLPDLYIENPYLNRVLRLGNYNSQSYRGWEVELVRRLSRKWQMEASYTHSVARGDAESALSGIGDDPSLAEFEPGYLNYDQRHVVKLNAISYLPREWRLGWTAQWSSGLPYSSVMVVTDNDDAGYYQDRFLYGRLGPTGFGLAREHRNIHRNPAAYLFNARLQKAFILGKASASAFFEVYNLLNSDALRVDYLQEVPPVVIYPDTGQPVVIRGKELLVGTRDFGRRFQIGIQVDF